MTNCCFCFVVWKQSGTFALFKNKNYKQKVIKEDDSVAGEGFSRFFISRS